MFHSLVLTIIFIMILPQPRCAQTNISNFLQEALVQHNYRRQMHCVPLIALNSSLNTIAQNYANYLAANNLFNHSATPGLGENLWALSSSVALGSINGSSAIESWYAEISSYNFNSPGYSSSTGHFTQVIWRASTQLGVGIAYSSTLQRAVVVANYLPPGNVIGAFAANVPDVCTTTTSTMNNSAIATVSIKTPILALASGVSIWFSLFA